MATVLVVEDEESIMTMLEARLRKAQYKIIEATTLEMAQEKTAQSGTPDLALIDLYLSDTYTYAEGIEACRWAKDDLGIPVIAMSAFLERDVRQKAAVVSDAILRKPEDLQLIIPTIEELLTQGAD